MRVGEAIDGASDANGEALDASREGPAIVRLRDQMEVIALHGELDE